MQYYKLSPDFPEHGGRVVYLGFYGNDYYFCLGSGYLSSETDKKYLIPIDLQTLEREDWQADHEPLPVMVHYELLEMIRECFSRCNVEQFPEYEYSGNNYYLIPNVNNLDMTAINFSADNAGKISGYKFNKLMSKTWENFTQTDKSKHPTHNIKNIINDFVCDIQIRRNEGTYIKPAKLIRGLFPDLTESQVTCIGSALADALRLRANPDTSGVEVSYKPSEVYIKSSSFTSCMRNQNPCRFQIYDDLEFTGIAYLVEDGELIGRALIHDKVFNGSEGETVKVMDRVYYNNSDTLQTFIAWAQKNGYWYKTEQAASHNVFCAPDNTIVDEPSLFIECGDLTDRGYDEVPYIDTFSYYDKRQEVLHNDCGDFNISTTFRETEGFDDEELVVQGNNRAVCCCCGERMDEDDASYHDDSIYCDDCFNERFSSCYHCGDTTDKDDLTQVHSKYGDTERVCEHCLDNHYVYCSDCEEYYHESRCECIDDEWYCEDCAENHVEEEEESQDED